MGVVKTKILWLFKSGLVHSVLNRSEFHSDKLHPRASRGQKSPPTPTYAYLVLHFSIFTCLQTCTCHVFIYYYFSLKVCSHLLLLQQYNAVKEADAISLVLCVHTCCCVVIWSNSSFPLCSHSTILLPECHRNGREIQTSYAQGSN